MRIFRAVLFTGLLSFLVACSNSSIGMPKSGQLLISNDQTMINVKTPIVEKRRINLSALYIDQNILAVDEARCLVYEDITTAAGYRFNHAYKRSIDLIFNAYDVKERKRYGNLTLYRLTLRDENRTKLNLLALTASKKSLKLLYGFNDEESAVLEKSLDQNNTVLHYELSNSTNKRDHCIKSIWKPKIQIIDNLVGKEGGIIPRIGK
ncbi:hypothetical protein [Sulfurimonas sp. HSL3-7]|uniref:hypothetical protein n=1 Tax=Sulfonitrofixus jiaomeiensis TaxID=3131938 RepID=UPI0031F8637B